MLNFASYGNMRPVHVLGHGDTFFLGLKLILLREHVEPDRKGLFCTTKGAPAFSCEGHFGETLDPQNSISIPLERTNRASFGVSKGNHEETNTSSHCQAVEPTHSRAPTGFAVSLALGQANKSPASSESPIVSCHGFPNRVL